MWVLIATKVILVSENTQRGNGAAVPSLARKVP